VARSHRGVLAEPMLVDTQTDLGCGISGVADRSGRRLGPLRGSGEHRPPRPWPAWTTAGSSAAAGWPARGVGGADYPGPVHARAARWQPSAWKLAHIEAVARLRLYMTDHEPTASWISERVIRQRWAGTGARIADDALAFRDGGRAPEPLLVAAAGLLGLAISH
jgi:hypothetical protein